MLMQLAYDRESDAIYILIRLKRYAFGEDIDSERRIDYSANHIPIGVELLNVSHGVCLQDLPSPEKIADLLRTAGIRVTA